MEGIALLLGILGFALALNALARIKALEEPIRQKKQEAALIAKAEMLAINEKNKKKG